MQETLIAHRRALHRIPELGRELPLTFQYIKGCLEKMDCTLLLPGGYAILAYFDAGKTDTIAFRSDMDALPIQEQTGFPFASVHPGKMHACGHDGHMAMLLGLAQFINDHRENLVHNVLLVFQPAEETSGGAKDICDTGVFQKYHVTRIFGIHLWPDLPAGVVGSKSGPLMARASEVTVDILGKSAHIAKASQGIDALFTGVKLVDRLYTMMGEELSKDGMRSFLFGRMESGTVRNAVSAHTHIEGTLRTFLDEEFFLIQRRAGEIAKALAEDSGCQITVHFSEGYPPVCNDPELFGKVADLLGEKLVKLPAPSLIAEDFSFYQREVPGVFFFLGTGCPEPLHGDHFAFEESILEQGFSLYRQLLAL